MKQINVVKRATVVIRVAKGITKFLLQLSRLALLNILCNSHMHSARGIVLNGLKLESSCELQVGCLAWVGFVAVIWVISRV